MTQSRGSDVVIIGGGPAGIAAAVWCAELNLSCTLIEQGPELGGQLLWTHNPIQNYPGVAAANGRELRDLFLRHIESKLIATSLNSAVTHLDVKARNVTLTNGSILSATNLIVATGVRRRSLNVPGEQDLRGNGVLASGLMARNEMAGKRIVIVGGGDAAVENALILSNGAEKIWIVHRRGALSARNEFVVRAKARPNIEFMMNSRVISILGDTAVRAVEVETDPTGRSVIECDAVLIRIGVEPNSELFAESLDLDERHYIVVSSTGETSRKGVYAVGDVAHRSSPTLCTAVGSGATAIKSILAGSR